MGKYKHTGSHKRGSAKVEAENGTAVEEHVECPSILEWHVVLAASIFISIYIKCTAGSIPSGDAGDFILSAYHFGVAHPPGYPLYVTVGHLWMKLLPFGNPAYRLNLLTSIIGGCASSIVYLTTYRITGFIPGAIFASGMFGFSHLIWFHSVGAEIFSLNNAFCAALLLCAVRFQQAPNNHRARVAMEASFLSGLSMCNQHTSGLFIATIGAWMFLSLLKDKAITIREFVLTGVAFAVALLPYVQLPISSFLRKSPSTWGDHRTFTGFWKHITREEYGTFRLTADDRPSDLFGNLLTYTGDIIHELGFVTFALCIFCLLTAWIFPKIRTIVYVLFATALGYIMFFCMQANVDHSKDLSKGVLERFWMQSNVVVCILAGCGVWCVYKPIKDRIPEKTASVLGILMGLCSVLATLHQIHLNYKVCDLSNNLIMRDYGRKLLDAAPKNGVLLVEGDMPSLTSRYLRYCENYRTDVDVVDQELIGFPWFKPMHKHVYKHYIFPHDREWYSKSRVTRKGANEPHTYNFADVFKVHIDDGIPLHIYPHMKEGDEGWKEEYETWPTTMTFEVRHKYNPYHLYEYLNQMLYMDLNFAPNMEYCDKDSYPARSWERAVAYSCADAAFLSAEHAHRLIHAEDLENKQHGLPLLYLNLELYQRAYNALTEPDGTNKKFYFGPDRNLNYGVMAYFVYRTRVSAEDPNASKYARIVVEQWQIYLARSGKPDDRGLKEVIKDALKRYPDLMTSDKHIL